MHTLENFYATMNDETLLYHYTSFETAAAYILPGKTLQLSPLAQSKDVMESINWFSPFKYAFGDVKDVSETVNNKIQKQVKILCFSKDSEIEGEPLPGMMLARMWSQYGNNHKGVCLVFSKELLLESFTHHFSDESCRKFKDISYNNYLFKKKTPLASGTITIINKNNKLSPVPNTFPELFDNPAIETKLFSKMIDFRDEQEFRLCCFDPSDSEGTYFPYHNALKAIILGYNTTKNQQEILKKIYTAFCSSNSVMIYKEYIKSQEQISLYNIHNPGFFPHIELRYLQENNNFT